MHRFPIRDCDTPSPSLMAEIQSTLAAAVEAGHVVYVHCWGGHGRTGTVAGCWLTSRGNAADQALKLMKDRRAHDKRLAAEHAPQTAAQRAFVSKWASATPPQNAPAGDPPISTLHISPAKNPVPAPSAASAWNDRATGAILGLAVGDAVGTTLEFKSPGSFQPLTDLVGGGPFHLKPGEWTDDTSMALCLAESLVERRYLDPVDQLRLYVRWWKEGHYSVKGHCFDIGNQVKAALNEFITTGKPFCGPIGTWDAGNGSLMRLAPVAVAYARTPAAAIVYAGESSRTTHGARECVDACRFFAGLLVGAISGTSKEELLGKNYCPIPGLWDIEPLAPKIAVVADGSYKAKAPPAIRGTGYVVDCLESALWAFHATDTYRDAVLLAANLGNDADTTAAVCGQIAGAYYGTSGIPENWKTKLAKRDVIESLGNALVKLAEE
jgi:ADP-ribosylglycohydrolase